ncbi:hypothetical protein FALBO_1029, partial [Fusarium albosuccineum]
LAILAILAPARPRALQREPRPRILRDPLLWPGSLPVTSTSGGCPALLRLVARLRGYTSPPSAAADIVAAAAEPSGLSILDSSAVVY